MLKLRDIMTPEVLTLSPNTSLRDAVELFAKHHVSGAPVVDGGKVVGVLSASDLLTFEASNPGVPTERDEVEWVDLNEEPPSTDDTAPEDEPAGAFFTDMWDDAGADVSERMSSLAGPEWDTLAEHDVEEIMTRKLLALSPDEPAERAANLMNEAGVHRVFITDKGRIVGVVSAMDIAQAVSNGQFHTRTYVFNRDRDFRST